jgi:hypothetical protein
LPISVWAVGLVAGIVGFVWVRKHSAQPLTATAPTQGAFTQQQEVQDFQVFSSLTGAQQASDLNFLSEVAGLFAGGSSVTTAPTTGGGGGGGGSGPPPTGQKPPATTPSGQGYGIVQTAQGPMVWLGVNQAGAPIYNVGGGAPVYFGNAQALATGSQYEQAGYDIYTPVSYENLVSANTSVLGAPYT